MSLFENPIKNRLNSDVPYYIASALSTTIDNLKQVNYTEDDEMMKMKIFEISSSNECIMTHKTDGVQKGDHLYPMRQAYTKIGGYGSNSKWNLIPVTGSLNKSYKNFRFEKKPKKNSYSKDIGYMTLTKDEYSLCTKQEQDLYNKIQTWKAYVISRGAFLFYSPTDDTVKFIYDTMIKMYEVYMEELKKKKSLSAIINDEKIEINLLKILGCDFLEDETISEDVTKIMETLSL